MANQTTETGLSRSKSSVRAKLQKATLGIWVLVSAATLGGVAMARYRESVETAARSEQSLREFLKEKGRVLLGNQVLALRGMALDNAFSDVQQLVRRTVTDDPDVVFGAFVDTEKSPWIFIAPTTPEGGLQSKEAAAALAKLGLDDSLPPTREAKVRRISAFGQAIEEHRADVFDGKDYLGTVRYGLGTQRTNLTVSRELARARRELAKTLWLVGGLGLAGLVLGAIAIRRAARTITKPLADLAFASDQIATGNRSFRADVRSGDELESLAQAFNLMADATESSMRQLEVKTEEALEASRLKSEFLANMSHEIRTPMNGILGVVKLVQRQPLDGKLRRYIETIDSSASALLTIINDVLDFSKMEAGKYTLQHVAFDIRSVVQDVAELLAPRAHEKGLELVYRIDPAISTLLLGDPDRTRQVLNNLVGNAIKFTEAGEVFIEVTLAAKTDAANTLHVSVRDSGIGIKEVDMHKLFDAFSQVDGSMVSKFGGTGLGLAISKHLVKMMGGNIGVKSELGKGSEFWFTVPLPIEMEAPASSRQPWTEGKRALLVEQNDGWRRVILEHLLAWGLDVECAHEGDLAVEAVARQSEQRKPFHIAVVGVQIADMSFESFVDKLRATTPGRTLPIIALYQLGLGAPLGEIERELWAQLPKPLRFSELFNTLQRAFVGKTSSHSRIKSSEKLPRAAASKRVLVVDDNEVNRFVAQETLEELGYKVETAENGALAVEKVKQEEFLIVLMDCQMPVMDGYEATREIRKWEKESKRHTTIVALTAHALSGERDRVLGAGMDDYLSKPVRGSALDKMIRRYASGGTAEDAAKAESAESASVVLSPEVNRSRRLIDLFLKNVPGQIEAIEQASKQGVVSDVRAFSHKTKGSCLAFGAPAMAQTSERIQRLSEEGNLAAIEPLVVALRQQYEEVVELLKRTTAS